MCSSSRQTYIEFDSVDATSTAKHLIDKMPADGGHLGQKKIQSQYWNPNANPFRTLPKDAPTRGSKDQPRSTTTTSYNERGNYQNHNNNYRGRGGFGGGRGGMNQNYNRGGYNNNMGYNNNNNNMGNNMGGGYGGPNPNNFGFNNRGNMMGGGMRGGPGMRGRGGNMMGMNPMGGMGNMGNMSNMGGMGGMGMGMPGNMGMGMMGPNGMPGMTVPFDSPPLRLLLLVGTAIPLEL